VKKVKGSPKCPCAHLFLKHSAGFARNPISAAQQICAPHKDSGNQ
jgi:hypothetical protein